MIYGTAEWATFLFLIAFFFCAEAYQIIRRKEGHIVSFYDPLVPLADLLGTKAKVQMKSGEIVDAEILSCTLCLGNFQVGDRVFVCKNQDKYVVSLPLFMKMGRKKGSCYKAPLCEEGIKTPLV